MFYFYALFSAFGYALQNVLLVPYARKMDGLSLAFFRGSTFLVTLTPLFIGSHLTDIDTALRQWPILIAGGFGGGLSLGLMYTAYRFIPIGVTVGLQRAFSTIMLAIAGWLFWKETLSPAAIALIAVILAASFFLGLRKHGMPHLDQRGLLGLTLVFLSAVPLAVAYVVFAILSRDGSPLVSGYFWEAAIGAGGFGLLVLRWFGNRQDIDRITGRDFLAIALRAWPTLIGTGCYGLALHLGPMAVISAVGTVSIVFSTLLAHWLFEEKIHPNQWLAILVIVAGVAGLKFV
ncbi:MAG: DMT family transporter [Candidatus Peribacteraceae bacterium]|jgi:drug/metabolite transporter (DMT)-like permease